MTLIQHLRPYWGYSMATINENLLSLKTAKDNIKIAIESKGQDLTNVPFTEYAGKISEIESGGSDVPATLTPEVIAGIWKAVLGDESQIYIWAYYVFSLKEDEQGNKLMKVFSIDDFESGTFTELPYTISGNNVIVDENGDEPLEFTYSLEDGKMTLNSESFPVPLTKIITGMGENEDNINPLGNITENGLYTPKTLNDTELLFFGANVNVPTSSGGIDRLQWKCDNVKSLSREFYQYTGTDLSGIDGLDVANVSNMTYFMYYCTKVTEVPKLINTGNVPNWSYAFQQCFALTEVEYDFSNAQKLNYAFLGCSSLKKININSTSLTNLNYAFASCDNLQKVELFDTSKVADFARAFTGDLKLTEVSTLDLSSCTNTTAMFSNCFVIETINLINTQKVATWTEAFQNCKKLKTLGVIDLYGATVLSDMFDGCNALENVDIRNIRQTIRLGSGTSYGTLLTNASLLKTAQELWDNTDNALGGTKTFGLSTASKTAIQSIYVKLVDVTDEMTAQDQYIANKKPCVECASADEGAMTLEEYIISKNWTIA